MKIKVSKSKLDGVVFIPGSKSHTIRAIVVSMMADGISKIQNPLLSEDTLSALNAAKKLGATIYETFDDKSGTIWEVKGTAGKLTRQNSAIDLGNSGTSLRLLTGLVGTTDLEVTFDGDESLRTRLMEPLIAPMSILGASFKSNSGKCPITIKGPMSGGSATVNAKSSQFLSSILFACPLLKNDSIIEVEHLNEKPYVDITVDWLKSLGIDFSYDLDYSKFKIKGNQKYKAFSRSIPADFSTALFPLVASIITKSKICLRGLDFYDKQGDKAIFDICKNMGVNIQQVNNNTFIDGDIDIKADRVIDLNATPDALPIVATLACFIKGKTVLTNVAHARIKECDRISAMTQELRKMGANIIENKDGLEINTSDLNPAIVNGHKDHRIIMSLAIAAMGTDGETIVENAADFSVTYPNFVKDFSALGANLEILD